MCHHQGDIEMSLFMPLTRAVRNHLKTGTEWWWSVALTTIAQCYFFSRNIGQVTPKTIYFHNLQKSFLDRSIQKKLLI